MKKNKLLLLCIVFFAGTSNLLSQDKEYSPQLIKEACDCLYKIDINLSDEPKNDSIRSCVTGAIIRLQTADIMSQMLKMVDSVKFTGDQDTITIAGDKNFVVAVDRDYDGIQRKLMKDCPALKDLLETNNKEHKNSYSENSKALVFYEKGQTFLSREEYESAIVEFTKAVKKDPNFAFAWDNLGVCYRRTNRLRQAIECYDKSLKLDPKGSVPLMNRAAAYDLLGEHQNAIAAYEKYIDVYPDDAEGFYGISRQQNITKDYANALESAFKALVIYDKAGSAYEEDAINVIREILANLRKEDKIDIYNTFAEKHGLEKLKK